MTICRQVWDNDIIRTTLLTAYVGQCLQQAEVVCGGPRNMQAYLDKADPIVLREVQKEINAQGIGQRRY